MVNETVSFLEKMMDVQKLYLSDFERLHSTISQVKNNFTEEINIV
jgi:hypothetical protein